MKRLINLFTVVTLFTAITYAVPCGTGGTPKAPTPSPKQDKGDSKAPSTPRPSK